MLPIKKRDHFILYILFLCSYLAFLSTSAKGEIDNKKGENEKQRFLKIKGAMGGGGNLGGI